MGPPPTPTASVAASASSLDASEVTALETSTTSVTSTSTSTTASSAPTSFGPTTTPSSSSILSFNGMPTTSSSSSLFLGPVRPPLTTSSTTTSSSSSSFSSFRPWLADGAFSSFVSKEDIKPVIGLGGEVLAAVSSSSSSSPVSSSQSDQWNTLRNRQLPVTPAAFALGSTTAKDSTSELTSFGSATSTSTGSNASSGGITTSTSFTIHRKSDGFGTLSSTQPNAAIATSSSSTSANNLDLRQKVSIRSSLLGEAAKHRQQQLSYFGTYTSSFSQKQCSPFFSKIKSDPDMRISMDPDAVPKAPPASSFLFGNNPRRGGIVPSLTPLPPPPFKPIFQFGIPKRRPPSDLAPRMRFINSLFKKQPVSRAPAAAAAAAAAGTGGTLGSSKSSISSSSGSRPSVMNGGNKTSAPSSTGAAAAGQPSSSPASGTPPNIGPPTGHTTYDPISSIDQISRKFQLPVQWTYLGWEGIPPLYDFWKLQLGPHESRGLGITARQAKVSAAEKLLRVLPHEMRSFGDRDPRQQQQQKGSSTPPAAAAAAAASAIVTPQQKLEDAVERNKIVSSSAIARAVQYVTNGEFGSAVETLTRAISLIRRSEVAGDERCGILVASLTEILEGINKKRSSRDRRGREDEHHPRRRRQRRSSSRERSRSREREGSRRRDDRSYRERERGGGERSRRAPPSPTPPYSRYHGNPWY